MAATSSRRAGRMETSLSFMSKTPDSARRRQIEKDFGLANPAADGRMMAEIEAALMREARIGEQRDVGERNRVTREVAACRQMLLHAVERRIAALDLLRIELGGVLAEIDELKATHR